MCAHKTKLNLNFGHLSYETKISDRESYETEISNREIGRIWYFYITFLNIKIKGLIWRKKKTHWEECRHNFVLK